MHSIAQDLRHVLRQLRHSPGFAITAVLTLALGIGANTAIFSVMNAVLLNPSGIPRASGVVALRARYLSANNADLTNIAISAPDFADALHGTDTFSSAAVMATRSYNLSGEAREPEQLPAARVSSRYFEVFQARPALGRVFQPEEDVPGAEHEVVLSDRAWKERFGADPGILGRSLTLDQQAYKVIGVMGPDFAWPNAAELWTPLALKPSSFIDPQSRFNEYLTGVARLQPGKTIAAANAYLSSKVQEVQHVPGPLGDYAKQSGWGMFSIPLTELISGDMQGPLRAMLVAVVLVLLIACANIAGLQLARASAREKETSVRVALGAGRSHLIRTALLESFVLTVLGTIAGLLLAQFVAPALLRFAPTALAKNVTVHFSTPVMLWVAGTALLCTVLCGLGPAWSQTRIRSLAALKDGGRSSTSGGTSQRLRSAMVVCEISLAMLLLFSASLVIHNLRQLAQVNTGFDPAGVISASINLPRQAYATPEKLDSFYSSLESQLANIPNAKNAAIADDVPFSGDSGSASFRIRGQGITPDTPVPHGNIRLVTSNYFSVLHIPVVAGRAFTTGDRLATQKVAIVDETLAKRYWPGENPIGKQIGFGGDDGNVKDKDWITVVGEVAHARSASLEADTKEGFYYLPVSQSTGQFTSFIIVRAARGDGRDLVGSIASAVRSVDSSLPLYDIETMQERVDASLVGRRFLMLLLSIFAGIALLLAALGLYGIVQYAVRLRTREIGIRLAVGAQRHDVVGLIVRQGMTLAAFGVVFGIVLIAALARVIAGLVYQLPVLNIASIASTVFLLLAVVFLASYLPARKASQLDPMKTLAQE
jgi:predicted permease